MSWKWEYGAFAVWGLGVLGILWLVKKVFELI